MRTHAGTRDISMEDTAEYPVPVRRASADGGFAMLSVILLILVFAAVSVLMLGAVAPSARPSQGSKPR